MLVYLIRHGETAWNRENRIQGREDIPLSPEGISQARTCAEALEGIPLAAVATSPLSRAVETARAIAQMSGIPLIKEPGLIERDFGDISGRVVDIFNPEKYTSNLEPLEEVADRMLSSLLKLAGELGSDFAAVSHGGSINALLRRLTGGDIGSGKSRLKNACICVIETDGQSAAVEDYNLTAGEFVEKYKNR